MTRVALVLIGLLAPAAAHAEMRLPPGFTVEVYVTGRGEAPDGRAAVGIPSTTSLAFDAAGALYTPHVPPNPIVTLPASTMTGTRRPPEMRIIRSSSRASRLTSMYVNGIFRRA